MGRLIIVEHSASFTAYLASAVIVVSLLVILAAMLRALMQPFLPVTMELGKKFWRRRAGVTEDADHEP